MQIKYYKASDLIEAEYNPRKLTKEAEKHLSDSLKRFGLVDPVLINVNPERKNIIIGGHQRVKIATKIGIKEIPCVELDLALEKEKELNIRLNKNTGAFDEDLLQEYFEKDHLIEFGFDASEIEFFNIEEVENEGLTDPDEVPEAPKDPITKPGDLYILGNHRLLCGDSTNVQHVERLLNGEKADMVFTDPPYGVNYEGGLFYSGDVNIKRKREKLANDADDKIYADVIPLIASFCDGPCYTWFADNKPLKLYQAVEKVGQVHALIIWHKTNATYAAMNAQYKQRHEPCLYWKPKGSTLRWCGASTEATIWEMKRDATNNFHPTQKPVELAERAIGNHKVQTVLDLFGGSGSTMIACEKTNRHARLMELDPAYCDVIVKRWEEFTGKKAELQKVEE